MQPTNVVEGAVHDDVSQIASGSGGEVLPQSPLFHSMAVSLGSRISAKIKAKTSPNPDKYALPFTAPSRGSPKTPQNKNLVLSNELIKVKLPP